MLKCCQTIIWFPLLLSHLLTFHWNALTRLTLKRIYNEGELVTNITRSERKEMFLCTKNVHFSYSQDIYIQKNGVVMGSHLGAVFAGIFMVNLERLLVPKLNSYMFMLTSGDVMWMTRSPFLKWDL